MYAKTHKTRFLYLLVLLLLLFLFLPDLKAQPPLRVLSIDSSTYPHINLNLSVRQPHLDFVKKEPKAVFSVSEIYENLEKEVKELNVRITKKKAQHLNLVWILDASLSLNARNFQRAITFSQKFIESFQNGERMAIYSAKAKPELLLDFSNKKEKLSKTLRYIKQDGKVTRLYDALYSGLYTAQSAWESHAKRTDDSRTVVVLLTDGKEESSYFNDNDCYELSSIGKRLNIPIYVLLWNGESVKKAKDETQHHRLLKKLTLRTNGELFSNPREREALSLLQKLYLLRHLVYRIDYLSQSERHGFPGTKVIVRVAFKEGGYGALSSFRVPWISLLSGSGSQITLSRLALALALLFSALFIFFFAISYRKRKAEKIEVLQKAQMEDYALFEKQLEKERAEERAKKESLSKKPQRGEERSRNKTEEIGGLADEEDPLPPEEGMRDANNVLIENERNLYLREHSYRLFATSFTRCLALSPSSFAYNSSF